MSLLYNVDIQVNRCFIFLIVWRQYEGRVTKDTIVWIQCPFDIYIISCFTVAFGVVCVFHFPLWGSRIDSYYFALNMAHPWNITKQREWPCIVCLPMWGLVSINSNKTRYIAVLISFYNIFNFCVTIQWHRTNIAWNQFLNLLFNCLFKSKCFILYIFQIDLKISPIFLWPILMLDYSKRKVSVPMTDFYSQEICSFVNK